MEKRFIIFMVLALLSIILNFWLTQKFVKPPPAAQKKAEVAQKPAAAAAKDADKKIVQPAEAAAKPAEPPQIAAAQEKQPEQWVALGSADPGSPYRMLVTLTNRGAAVERIELNSPRYRDVENWEDRSGYLGQLEPIAERDHRGVQLRVVGPGTPAALAGLQAGDILTEVGARQVRDPADLIMALRHTRPDQDVKLAALRDGKRQEFKARMIRPPLCVIKPEGQDPLSYLVTLERLDGQKIADNSDELPGLKMRTDNWKLLPSNDPDEATFEWLLPQQRLQVLKRFRLSQVPAKEQQDLNFPAYHLEFSVEIHNTDKQPHTIAYRLDGPTGLPTEGSWYSYKVSRNWGGAGLRDVVAGFYNGAYAAKNILVSCTTVVDKPTNWDEDPLLYIGVDSQYFSSVLIPQQENPAEKQFARESAIRVGPVPDDKARKNRTDVSCRITSQEKTLDAGGQTAQQFKIFAGPKKPELLSKYQMEDMIYYGWFGFVAKPMLGLLHFFYHHLVHNYGIAIIMLTVLVRSAMFPISRRQALNAQKMQELQPEIKRIAEKYKTNMEARTKAQQELFRKHSYNPLAGCLPVFLQLPIFMGLYRSLAVDVELRQAPLLSESIRWCSNLSAPDMMWYWEPLLPGFLGAETGWLGPYLNILPLVTIGLFLWQQKMFMPPPTDEQSAMQQKMMQYMMIFMSFMFFKVPSGLCLYFIASSLWSVAEKKLLPKSMPAGAQVIDVRAKTIGTGGNGSTGRDAGRKQRGKK